jgi:hypothetical protein
MRRLMTLAALLPVLTVAIILGVTTALPLYATMCTTNCSIATLSCTPVTSCTSVPGTSLTCDGVVTTCTVADAWCACRQDCSDYCNDVLDCGQYGPGACHTCLNTCQNTNCGSTPANTACPV